jgi:hypothetical protein
MLRHAGRTARGLRAQNLCAMLNMGGSTAALQFIIQGGPAELEAECQLLGRRFLGLGTPEQASLDVEGGLAAW